MNEVTLVAAFSIGLLSSAHCLGMCGGLSNLLGMTKENWSWLRLVSYNAGRILTYMTLGAIFGFLGQQLSANFSSLDLILRCIAGLLLIAMGLYLSQWWMGITKLEKFGLKFWRHVQPLTQKLLPINSNTKAFGIGALWGLLPCGLIYTNISLALATANWFDASLYMGAFGLGTLPMMLASGISGHKLINFLRNTRYRAGASILVIGLGVSTIIFPATMLSSTADHCHEPHMHTQHETENDIELSETSVEQQSDHTINTLITQPTKG